MKRVRNSRNGRVAEILRIKDEVRQRDGFRCVQCGLINKVHVARYGRILDVHRKVAGSEYTVDGCVTLCKLCHGPQPRSPRGSSPNSTLRVSRTLSRAVRLCALKEGARERREITYSEVVNSILRQALATEIAEVEGYPGADSSAPPATPPPRKRKKKSSPPPDSPAPEEQS